MSDGIDVPEVKDITGDSFYKKDQEFSHPALVHKAFDRCRELLSREMREGHMELVTDVNGVSTQIYYPDNRLESIEAIKTLKNVMIADLEGTKWKEKIDKLLNEVDKIKEKWVEQQLKWFEEMEYEQQQLYLRNNAALPACLNSGTLYPKEIFYQEFINERVLIYRRIFECLEMCIASIKYFKKQRRTDHD